MVLVGIVCSLGAGAVGGISLIAVVWLMGVVDEAGPQGRERSIKGTSSSGDSHCKQAFLLYVVSVAVVLYSSSARGHVNSCVNAKQLCCWASHILPRSQERWYGMPWVVVSALQGLTS